jgi:hypothetical protein
MVGHKAVPKEPKRVSRLGLPERVQERAEVFLVPEYGRAIIATIHRVVHKAGTEQEKSTTREHLGGRAGLSLDQRLVQRVVKKLSRSSSRSRGSF